MTQSDMLIDTIAGQVEEALQALASSSKGGTAPSTAYAGQLWLDDSTANAWVLNFFDGADWIPLGTLDDSQNRFLLKHEIGGLEFDASGVVDGDFVVGTGTGTMGLESGATARAKMGLGSISSQAANNVAITGGDVTGITDLAVADGGTGTSSLTDGGPLIGSGTGAITALTAMSDGNVLVGDGVGDPGYDQLLTAKGGPVRHEHGGLEFDAGGVVDGDFVVGTGTGTMGLESGATARTTMGVGSTDTPTFSGVNLGDDNLSNYEEGTWTPTLIGLAVNGTHTYTAQVGKYTRIGNRCFIDGHVKLSNWDGTATGQVGLSGLPFTVLNLSSYTATMAISFGSINLSAGYGVLAATAATNTTRIDFTECGDNVASGPIQVAAMGNTSMVRVTGSYEI